ncbi:MAG: DNA polymerase III subunit delta' [Candidatus Sedimenticola sp. 20ELBAFRAG]
MSGIELTEDAGMVFPWHQAIWERLLDAHARGRLPHALLLTGAEGVGKQQFAKRLARSLLCGNRTPDGEACGACQGCHLIQAGTHPDFKRIEPEEAGKAIRIDTVRAFTDKEGFTSQAGGYKVTIIEPADALNVAAANSLLKTLEEPVPWTVMMLITSKPGRLPATIRSRCQQVMFSIPERSSAQHWLDAQGVKNSQLLLDLASGAPIKALQLSDAETLDSRNALLDDFFGIHAKKLDPVLVATRWSKLDMSQVLPWMCGWVIDILRLKTTATPPNLINSDQKERLQGLAGELELKMLYQLLDAVYQSVRSLGTQLNAQMMLEKLLLNWAACARK